MRTVVLSIALCCLLALAAGAQEDSVRIIRSVPTDSPTLDGKLEAEWWSIPPQNGFIQRDPKEGQPATERTDLRLMHSPTALFAAFRCYDSEPEKIVDQLTKHDRYGSSDFIALYLDTFHDHRSGYCFIANPSGVQAEGALYNDDEMDNSWDGYWELETTRDDSGWVAEFKIPFSTLRFRNDIGDQVWGLNVQRYIVRKKEGAFWQKVTRDQGRRVSGFGHLEGLSGLRPGRGLELRPYAVANFQEQEAQPLQGENDWDNLGLDLKYRLAPNLILDATYNPDFAQIEADDEVINLSDYPVYLTEKRPFFLEGSSALDMPEEIFYSRRITNPDFGGKITGKVGGLRLMGLAARNLNEDNQKENFAVLGLNKDILKRSQISLFLTDKEGPDTDYARLWNANTRLQISDPLNFEIGAAQSFRPGLTQNNWVHSIEANYGSDTYSGTGWYSGTMRDFNSNDAGWAGYSDVHSYGGWFQYAPRPEKWGIRRISHNFNFGGESKYDLSHQEGWCNYNNSFTTMNYMYFGGGASYSEGFRRKRVDDGESYDDYDNFGHYVMEWYPSFWQWIWFETDFDKPLAFAINGSQGDYRDGYERDLYTTLQLRPRENIELRLQEEWAHIKGTSEVEDGAATDFFVGRFKAEWTLTRHLFTRLNSQYIFEEGLYLTNALIAYNFAPESFLYLVYDDSRAEFLGWDSVQDRKIKMKVSYFVQI